MLSIKIAAGTRRTIVVDETKSVKEILDEENVNTRGASISLDGMVLTETEQEQSLADNGAVDGSILGVVVKADSTIK